MEWLSITKEFIKIGKLEIPFWILFLLFLCLFVFQNSRKIRKHCTYIFDKIKKGIILICTKVVNWYNQFKIQKIIDKTKLLFDKRDKEDYRKKQFFVIIAMVISIVITMNILSIFDIYQRNVPIDLRSAFLISFLILFLIIFIFYLYFSSTQIYMKEFSLWLVLAVIMYFLTISQDFKLVHYIGGFGLVGLVIFYPLYIKEAKPPRIWFWLTILVMLTLLILGVVFIDSAYGGNNVNFNLNIDGNQQNKLGKGNILVRCQPIKTASDTVGLREVSCNIDDELVFQEGILEITYNNNKTQILNLNQKGSTFFRDPEISVLYFKINGTYKNEKIFVSSRVEPEFKILEKQRENEKEFVEKLLFLLTAVFISVPIMMYNLRHLFKRETDDNF